jgi:small-conductance mechanosensitive channel
MGTVTNFSRDYIITKLDFRVRYDADVEKIRKIIKKKVYKEVLKDEELSSKLLGKIKSQGVRELDDSAMVMRVKFKSIPGEQFVLRKEIFKRMQEAFQEEGIEFAHKNVTVYLPPETRENLKSRPDISEQSVIEAAAGAASVQAAEEEAAAKAAKSAKK